MKYLDGDVMYVIDEYISLKTSCHFKNCANVYIERM